MNQIIEKIKAELKKDGFNATEIVKLLKELRENFKKNLKEPALVRMLRLAYEDIEANGAYTYLYIEDDSAKDNFAYFIDLIGDHNNKYNKEELQDIRNLMDGIVPDEDEDEETE